jgi:uncharacterized protein
MRAGSAPIPSTYRPGPGRPCQHRRVGRLRIDRLTGPPAPLRRGGAVLAARCHLAASRRARLVGLLGTPDLAGDEALWLPGCAGVHTVGMRGPIGCAFVDGDGVVLRVRDPLPAWRLAGCRGAAAVVELPAGALLAAGIGPGARLRRDDIPATSGKPVPRGG